MADYKFAVPYYLKKEGGLSGLQRTRQAETRRHAQ
jgi:hypothetical protein